MRVCIRGSLNQTVEVNDLVMAFETKSAKDGEAKAKAFKEDIE